MSLWTIEIVSPAKSTPTHHSGQGSPDPASAPPPMPLSDGLDTRPCQILDPPLVDQHFINAKIQRTLSKQKKAKVIWRWAASLRTPGAKLFFLCGEVPKPCLIARLLGTTRVSLPNGISFRPTTLVGCTSVTDGHTDG